jgi:hypothetical protein
MLSAIYAKCRKEAHYAECRYAECRYVECLGAPGSTVAVPLTLNLKVKGLHLATGNGREIMKK